MTNTSGVIYAVYGGVAYLPSTSSVIYFGGDNPTNGTNNETWSFGHGVWTELHPAVSPPALQMVAMAYDPHISAILLFGGEAPNSNVGLNETWEYGSGGWTQLHPAKSPSPRASAEMIYDPAVGAMVLFGGTSNHCCGGTGLSDTWEFTNGTWVPIATASSPPPVNQYAMTYDPDYNAPIIFGGWNPNAQGPSGSAWKFSGNNWTQISNSSGPQANQASALSYDPVVGRAVYYGGLSGAFSTSLSMGQTWTLNATRFVQRHISPNPGPLSEPQMIYDPAIKGILLWGGFQVRLHVLHSGTWVFS